jgi:acyl transferase domain-containing protein
MQSESCDLTDLAFTLSKRREHFQHRAYCITDGKGAFAPSQSIDASSAPQVVFVFTGQGAQHAEMAKNLCLQFLSFDQDIRRLDEILAKLPNPPTWAIRGTCVPPH